MAEAAALALAVLPVIISAAEHYRDCVNLVTSFKEHEAQLRRFRLKLKTQEILFRHQCVLMLKELVDGNTAEQMLSNKDHRAWTDYLLDHSLAKNLQDFKQPCIDTIREAETVLKELKDIEIKSTTKGKIKFAVLKSSFEESIHELDSLNGNLRLFGSQIAELRSHGTSRGETRPPKSPEKALLKAKAVQKASLELYQSLDGSCEIHSSHKANFCLVAQTEISHMRARVRFKLTFSRHKPDERAHPSDEAFLIIESSLHYPACFGIYAQESHPNSANSKKSANHDYADTNTKKMKKDENFQAEIGRASQQANAGILPNLCLNRNLCTVLRLRSQQTFQRDTLLGRLESCGDCEHQVYSPVLSAAAGNTPKSLEAVLSWASAQDPLGGLTAYEKISMARCLAAAALQYQETPWLKGPWSSEEIFFYECNSIFQPAYTSLTEPHVRIDLEGPNGARSVE